MLSSFRAPHSVMNGVYYTPQGALFIVILNVPVGVTDEQSDSHTWMLCVSLHQLT